MQSGQMTIFDMFDGAKIFNIPKYQRAYAWEERHLKDFVDDLENQLTDQPENQQENKHYFLGTILFQLQPDQGFFKRIDIVDGQQRMTTVIIFMKLLLDRLQELREDTTILVETYLQRFGEYKLRVLEQDNTFFQAYILQDHPVIDGAIKTPSQHRLLAAKQYLASRLQAYNLAELQRLQEKLRSSRILMYSVNNTANATLIFETTNDRGKQLTNLEKTKSFLMYKAYLCFEHPESHLDSIQSQFSELYRDYEAIQDRINEDSILQYHFIAFEQWGVSKTDKDYYHYVQKVKDKVNRFVGEDKRQEGGEYIQQYTRELRESYTAMRQLLLNEKGYLTNLIAAGRPTMFYPLLIKVWKYDQSEEKTLFRRVVRLAEIYSFKVLGINRRRADTGRDYIFGLARDFTGDFDTLINRLRKVIDRYCNNNDFKKRLMASDFYRVTYSSDMRYLFWQYENYLRQRFQPKAAPMSYAAFANQDHSTRLTIEHIAPQKPNLKVVENAAILPEMTEDFLEKYLHCLGNLTFDPHSANASKSNNDVSAKMVSHFRRAPFKTQNELDDFLNDGNWDITAVEARRTKIIDFALAHWNQYDV